MRCGPSWRLFFKLALPIPCPRDMGRQDALAYWFTDGHEVFVAEEDGAILGTYFLKANQKGGGSHVANCGYMTAREATGRGVARRMCEYSLVQARSLGFRAIQFNFVVSTNERAVRLWQAAVSPQWDASLRPSCILRPNMSTLT